MITVITKSFSDVPICEKEILRYAGSREANEGVSELLREALEEALPRMSYKVCYCVLPVKIAQDMCDFDVFSVKSEKLAKNLEGCATVMIFAATVGIEIDRLITKYGRLSPSRALMMQAIGAERIESLCNAFNSEVSSYAEKRGKTAKYGKYILIFYKITRMRSKKFNSDIDICVTMCYNLVTLILEKRHYD